MARPHRLEELAVGAQHRLPYIHIVVNNAYLGLIRQAQRNFSMDFEAALLSLPDGAREIFVLHDVEGYKHHEIGTLLDISSGTSKAQLHRARMMLRRYLKSERSPESARLLAAPADDYTRLLIDSAPRVAVA